MQEFTGHLEQLVSSHEIRSVSPGVVMPVGYEPENPAELYTVPGDRQEEVQDLFNRQQEQLGLTDLRAAEVRERGVPVTGVVMSMTPTGEIRHGYTGMETTVRFTNLHGDMVERCKGMFVPPSVVDQLGVGRQVQLRVLPEDDTQLVLEVRPAGDTAVR